MRQPETVGTGPGPTEPQVRTHLLGVHVGVQRRTIGDRAERVIDLHPRYVRLIRCHLRERRQARLQPLNTAQHRSKLGPIKPAQVDVTDPIQDGAEIGEHNIGGFEHALCAPLRLNTTNPARGSTTRVNGSRGCEPLRLVSRGNKR